MEVFVGSQLVLPVTGIVISGDFSVSELVQYLFPLNFQEMAFFVHQNVPNSLTVNIIMVFIHWRRNIFISS